MTNPLFTLHTRIRANAIRDIAASIFDVDASREHMTAAEVVDFFDSKQRDADACGIGVTRAWDYLHVWHLERVESYTAVVPAVDRRVSAALLLRATLDKRWPHAAFTALAQGKQVTVSWIDGPTEDHIRLFLARASSDVYVKSKRLAVHRDFSAQSWQQVRLVVESTLRVTVPRAEDGGPNWIAAAAIPIQVPHASELPRGADADLAATLRPVTNLAEALRVTAAVTDFTRLP
ncbi:hypothetical protein [Nocardia pseudovaccinii]|uniref:hypothetical protein n=1 Tax=Nocardia pseudovaccinii TaxID=189540 RepID=UPI0007A38716|nr:hypothetical protein [Nocardia pseudovaccinii]